MSRKLWEPRNLKRLNNEIYNHYKFNESVKLMIYELYIIQRLRAHENSTRIKKNNSEED